MRFRLSLLAVVGVLLCVATLTAQGPEIAARISGPINEKSLVSMHGNVPGMARAEFDQGEAAPSTLMTHVRLVLARSPEQQAALDQYDAELLQKSSPNYHKWLTPEEFGKLYGPADSDIDAIVAWLESHGLQVDPVAPGRTNVSFSGSVPQIEQLLHTTIHTFEANGEEFLSNTTNPQIPAALAGLVSGVAHLDTIRSKPQYVRGGVGQYDQAAKRMRAVSTNAGPRPALTTGTGTATDPFVLYLVAGDAATIYDTPNSHNANFSSGTSYTGAGVTIGLGGDAVIDPAIVATYRTQFVGDSTQPTITNVDNVTSTSDSLEGYIDTEIAGGLAPGAAIHFYTSTDLVSAINQMLTDNSVDIFSLSFGACELALTTANNTMLNNFWQQASTQGIAVAVSTGDSGSAGCDYPNSNASQVAMQGIAVSGWASTPFNVAVGGTDLAGLANFTTYVSVSDGPLHRSAKSYIPESTWNDSTITNTTVSQDAPFHDTTSGFTNIVAGAGGKSSCSTTNATGTACVSGYAKPSWQRGTGVPSDGVRDLPDVSLMSGAGGDNAAWLVCTNDTFQNGTITTNCSNLPGGGFYFIGAGGTSAATPAFAGMLAMVQEKTGGRLGQAAKELYDLYNGAHASAIFHDITVGNISVPCATGSPDCKTNTAGNLFLTGYDTSANYDLATGMGSVDAAQLITFWGTATGDAAATVTVSPAQASFPRNQSTTVDVTVAGSGGLATPTGTVTISGGGYTSNAQALSSGSTTFTIPAKSLAIGTDTLVAIYNGDATNTTYGVAHGTATVTVTGPTFSLSATPVTLTAGATTGNSSTITVTPSGGYAGTVTLTAAVTASPAGAVDTPTLTGSAVAINSAAAKQGTVTVATTASSAVRGHPGSAWFKAAGGTALAAILLLFVPLGSNRGRRVLSVVLVLIAGSFSVVGCGGGGGGGGGKTTPSVSVTPSKTTFSASTAITAAITVSGGTQAATGTVTLSGGGFNSTATTLSGGAATINIPANSLSTGSVTLTATYSGDSNFNGATGSATVTVSKTGTTAGAYTVTVTGTGDDADHTTATTTFILTVN